MATEDVSLRLSLQERRQTAAGLAEVRDDLGQVAAAGDDVARSGDSAAKKLAKIGGRGVLGALNLTRRGVLSVGTGLTKGLLGAAKATAVGVTATTVAVGALGAKSIQLASDARETGSAFNTVFGGAARQVDKDLTRLSTKMGLYLPDLQDASRQFGVFGKAAGIARAELPGFSTDLVKAGLDLGSFYNQDPSAVFEALQSGLSGESEPLRQFGIFLSDASLGAFAMSQGITKATKDMSEQEKVALRQQFILANLGDAQGDLARTSTGYANQQRGLTGRVKEFSRVLGGPLTTVMTGVVRGLNAIARRGLKELRAELPGVQGDARNLSATLEHWLRLMGRKIPGSIDRVKAKSRDLSGTFRDLRSKAADFFGGLSVPGGTGQNLAGIAASLRELGPAFQAAADSGIENTLVVTNAVFGFFADHVDTLVTLMPLLVAAFVAVKVAQAAANLVSVFGVALRIAEWRATRAQTAAIIANTAATGANATATGAGAAASGARTTTTTTTTTAIIANTTATGVNGAATTSQTVAITSQTVVQQTSTVATGANTAATGANTAATNVGILARIRSAASIVAWRAIALGAAVASGVMTAAQWALNVALSANPIGLVVAAIALLVGGFVLAYKKSDTFRGIIDGLWKNVLKPFGAFIGKTFLGYLRTLAVAWLTMAGFAVKAFRLLVTAAFKAFDGILAGAERGLGWVPGLGDKIKGARRAFDKFGDATIDKLKGVERGLRDARDRANELGRDRKAKIDVSVEFHQNKADRDAAILGNIDGRATGGPVRKGTPYIVGEKRPELFVPDENGTIVPRLGDGVLDYMKPLGRHVTAAPRTATATPTVAAQRADVTADLERLEDGLHDALGPGRPIVVQTTVELDGQVVAESTWKRGRDAEARQ